ncbi:hypothetical protein JB92DRAFT_850655 [Gautieria morchelliformis]|nr:hypothetical protein JB92DRAFT_850655 [Gautieria morchelliformis]
MRGRKRPHLKLDTDEPSEPPANRRRTRSMQPKEYSQSTKSPHADQVGFNMVSEDEVLKTRKRTTPRSEASTMSKSRTKSRGGKCLAKAPQDSQKTIVPSGTGEDMGSRDMPQSSTVLEIAAGRHGRGVARSSAIGPSPVQRAAGTEIVTQNLGMTKRRRKKVKTQADDLDDQDQRAAQTFKISKRPVSPHPMISGSKSHQEPRQGIDKHIPLVSDTQKSQANSTVQSNTERRRPAGLEKISLVSPAKKSKRKNIQPKERKVKEPRHHDERTTATVQPLNKPSPPRELHVQPAMDSDFDELDLLS